MPEVFRIDVEPSGPIPWLDGVFLGWEQDGPPYRAFVVSSEEDSVAILGPPRVGKTSGLLIPQALTWPGSLISASTKPDVLRATRGRRLEAAAYRDGDVYVYAPTDPREQIDGVQALRWSPASGCEDPTVCEIRVQKMLGPEPDKKGGDDSSSFFRQAAATVMRGFYHAAALSGCGMRRVKRWIDSTDVEEAIEILMSYRDRSHAAEDYASALEGITKQAPATLASTFGTVAEKMAALIGNATALANADHGDFDVDRFLRTGSTLYVISPEATQAAVAPLVAGLVEAIVLHAYSLAAQNPSGRIDPPLLLLLDEVGAIAPLPSLPAIMAQGAGQGVIGVWAAQSISQMKARWGEEWSASIWNASTQKVLFGNLGDTELLEKISQSFGDYDRRVSPYGDPVRHALISMATKSPTPPVVMKERVLQVSQLHELPPGTACLLGLTPRGRAMNFVGTPPAFNTPPFAAAQQQEMATQQRIASSQMTPAALRNEQMRTILFQSMPQTERDRFVREESDLLSRIAAVEALAPEQQRLELARDPELARELLGIRHLRTLGPDDRAAFQRQALQGFSQGWMPHVSFASAAPRSRPRSSRRRAPDPYRYQSR